MTEVATAEEIGAATVASVATAEIAVVSVVVTAEEIEAAVEIVGPAARVVSVAIANC